MQSIQNKFPSFDVSLKGLGAFPTRRRAKVLWVGIDRGKDNLIKLFSVIEDKLTVLGFGKEKREFHPHVTFARVKKGKYSLSRNIDFSFDSFPINKIILFKSTLTPGGPVYEIVSEVPLRRG